MELTKHNLRLLIFEDVLHYHPECRGLIPPRTNALAAAGGTSSQPSSRPSSGSGYPILGNQSSRASTGGRPRSRSSASTPRVSVSGSPPPPSSSTERLSSVGRHGARTPLPAPPVAGTARLAIGGGADEDGSPAWPPVEAAGPSAGLAAGPAAGAAGWAGDGVADDAVVLAAAATVREAKEVGGQGGGLTAANVSGTGVGPMPAAGLVTAV